MEKMKVVEFGNDRFDLVGRNSRSSCKCTVRDLRFDDTNGVLNMQVDWDDKGRYTNGKLKKMIARTMISLLRSSIQYQTKLDKQKASRGI